MPNPTPVQPHTNLHQMNKRDFWFLPSLGPLSLAMAHRWSQYASQAPSTWMVEDIAKTFGIGESISRVCQPIDRLEKFGIIRRTGRTVAVRLSLPPLTERQIARLPDYLAAVYPG